LQHRDDFSQNNFRFGFAKVRSHCRNNRRLVAVDCRAKLRERFAARLGAEILPSGVDACALQSESGLRGFGDISYFKALFIGGFFGDPMFGCSPKMANPARVLFRLLT